MNNGERQGKIVQPVLNMSVTLILNNAIELNDINKTYNSYKLIRKKQFLSFT